MSTLAFRNLDVSPDSPVESWPHEAVYTAIERGYLSDWRKIAHAVDADPYGKVATVLKDVLEYIDPQPAARLLETILEQSRERADQEDRETVAASVRQILAESGLSITELAHRIGTSRSRLSTWASGKVVPSATNLLRLRRALSHRTHTRPESA
jgi:DNA-binding transcriptional regulator YiaG